MKDIIKDELVLISKVRNCFMKNFFKSMERRYELVEILVESYERVFFYRTKGRHEKSKTKNPTQSNVFHQFFGFHVRTTRNINFIYRTSEVPQMRYFTYQMTREY